MEDRKPLNKNNMSNHHYRSNYEKLYERLCNESGIAVKRFEMWSNYRLLFQINLLLSKLNLTQFTEEELEIDLI